MNNNNKLKVSTLFFAAMSAITAFSQSSDSTFSYMPEVHGVVRARWEMHTESGEQRFQLRNARVNFSGKVAPSISYYVQADFGDKGKVKFLDGWAKLGIVKGLDFQAGQFRMPFGIEPHLGPSTYLFSNRAFIGKQMMNYRAVGAKLSYKFAKMPLSIEGGVFNPSTIDDQSAWSKTVAASAKAVLSLPLGWKVSASYATIKPGETRANLLDAYLSWADDSWTVTGEYIFKNYCNEAYDDAHGYVFFADWRRPVKLGVFNRWSVQARLDGMTDHYQLNRTDDAFNPERTRITLGTTLSYRHSKFAADVRLNYENNVDCKSYDSDAADRLVAELVVTF